ncbi:aKG-HExxH-type peptide beta-hydroxylase [Streptomyces sp. NPDC088348]|uniref:aKG-HExxH-type peptide beta-hydroxylase n=1 Tax=Streptomyces sp. NPDC088348 TaxID=3365853 RepID=UPI0037F1A862
MQVEPDARGAVQDRTELTRRMSAVLDRAGLPAPPDAALYRPAVVEVVHAVQRALRSGALDPDRRRTLEARLDREPDPMCAPATPRGHLSRSVARALRSVPARTDADGRPVHAEVTAWSAAERQVLDEAFRLLSQVWPESAAETRETVAEIALLDGNAIDGFTDFTVHGAVLVNRTRLLAGPGGLPGPVRCAEALIHEGAHTRCNAAASVEPFLLPDRSGVPDGSPAPDRSGAPGGGSARELLVATPLRADPRPLSGLFQQTVVLARSVLLYRRLAGSGAAADARHTKLAGDGAQAVRTLSAHADSLAPRGRRVLEQCAGILGERE